MPYDAGPLSRLPEAYVPVMSHAYTPNGSAPSADVVIQRAAQTVYPPSNVTTPAFQMMPWTYQSSPFPNPSAYFPSNAFYSSHHLWNQRQVPKVFTIADDQLLVRTLVAGGDTGKTALAALEGLHGVNNFTQTEWKDYYLDHVPRINALAAVMSAHNSGVIEAPDAILSSANTLTASSTSQQLSGIQDAIHSARCSRSSRALSLDINPASFNEVATNSAASASSPTLLVSRHPRKGKQLVQRARHSGILVAAPLKANRKQKQMRIENPLPGTFMLPPIPSERPLPSSHATSGESRKFTDDDCAFFVAFVGYELDRTPDISRALIYKRLAEQTPHCTARAWRYYWERVPTITDALLSRAEAGGRTVRRERPQRKSVVRSDRNAGSHGGPGSWGVHEEDEDYDLEESTDDGDGDYGIVEQHSRRSPAVRLDQLTPATAETVMRAAQFIAGCGGWDNLCKKEQGQLLAQNVDGRRTGNAWNCLLWYYDVIFAQLVQKLKANRTLAVPHGDKHSGAS